MRRGVVTPQAELMGFCGESLKLAVNRTESLADQNVRCPRPLGRNKGPSPTRSRAPFLAGGLPHPHHTTTPTSPNSTELKFILCAICWAGGEQTAAGFIIAGLFVLPLPIHHFTIGGRPNLKSGLHVVQPGRQQRVGRIGNTNRPAKGP